MPLPKVALLPRLPQLTANPMCSDAGAQILQPKRQTSTLIQNGHARRKRTCLLHMSSIKLLYGFWMSLGCLLGIACLSPEHLLWVSVLSVFRMSPKKMFHRVCLFTPVVYLVYVSCIPVQQPAFVLVCRLSKTTSSGHLPSRALPKRLRAACATKTARAVSTKSGRNLSPSLGLPA